MEQLVGNEGTANEETWAQASRDNGSGYCEVNALRRLQWTCNPKNYELVHSPGSFITHEQVRPINTQGGGRYLGLTTEKRDPCEVAYCGLFTLQVYREPKIDCSSDQLSPRDLTGHCNTVIRLTFILRSSLCSVKR